MRQSIFRIVSTLRSMLLNVSQSANLSRYAIRGAWFFAIVSAVPLIWLMLEGHGSDGSSRVFGTEVNGVVHSVWGLTYAGIFGSILLWLELFALVAATLLAALPANFKFARHELTGRLRRIGLSYLTGWAGLWMIGAMYLATVDPGFWIVQASFITILFACTVYRAVREWNPQLTKDEPASPAVQSETKRSPEPTSCALTDVADVSRFMLYRSAVRHSDRVTERELDASVPPSRLFATENARPKTALDDDYGDSLRAAVRKATRFAKRGLSEGISWIKRSARTIASTLHEAARTTRSA